MSRRAAQDSTGRERDSPGRSEPQRELRGAAGPEMDPRDWRNARDVRAALAQAWRGAPRSRRANDLSMLMAYASVAAFFLVSVGFMLGSLLVGKLLRPTNPYAGKLASYECGEATERPAWFNYNPRFYVVALIYVIFDVEIALVFPVVTVFKRWVQQAAPGARSDLLAFGELFIFVAILMLGLAYVWVKGDLEWVRAIAGRAPSQAPAELDAAPSDSPQPEPLIDEASP